MPAYRSSTYLYLINTTPTENLPLPGFHGVMMLTSPGNK